MITKIAALVVVAVAAATGAAAPPAPPGPPAPPPGSYEVSGTWTLTIVNQQPQIQPELVEDTANVNCRNGNHMISYRFNDDKLVAGSWRRVDNTGLQVEPKLSKPGEQLIVTITCNGHS
jgi:hypothetical protein